MTVDPKVQAIGKHLGCAHQDDIEVDGWCFEANGGEYLVLTDDEAYDMCKEQILDSLWAIRAEFLVSHMDLGNGSANETIAAIKAVQEKCFESCNALLFAAIRDTDDFVTEAISADGRGHFLAIYDHEEHEGVVDGQSFYIYRVN